MMNSAIFSLGRRVLATCVAAGMLATVSLAEWKQGDKLPSLEQFELSGGDVPSVQGKVTYIDFWASWCPPCKAAFPSIESLYQKYEDEGFQVIAISLDANEKAMQRFLEKADPSFLTVRDESNASAQAAGVQYMPTSYLVGPDGVIRSVHVGWGGTEAAANLEQEIRGLLDEIER